MITETRIRKIFQPLNFAVSIQTDGVSLSQVTNQYEDTVVPERKNDDGCRTILRPFVHTLTGTNDSTWTDDNYTKSLVEVKWFANGVDISVSGTPEYEAFHKAGSPLFDIVSSSDDDNGSLRIWKNLAAEEHYAMMMCAKLYDSRTRSYHEIRSDVVEISANALGEDEWDFSIVHDVNIQYNPLLDRLKLYDWLKAKGESVNKADYRDATAYDLNLPILVTKGHTKYIADDHITFELQDHNNYHQSLNSADWVVEFDKEHIRIDQRKLPHKTLVVDVVMKVDGNVQSQEQLTFSRVLPHVQILMSNSSNIDLGSTSRWERAVVMFDDSKVEYPEAFLAIKWGARSSLADQWTEQGYGELIDIDQSALGVTVGGRDKLYLQAQCYMKTGVEPLSNTDVIKNEDSSSVIVASITATRNEVYTPLSITSYLTPSGQSVIQTDGVSSTQRTEQNPLILTPTVIAMSSATDVSWTDGNCNALLTNIKWLANDVDISTLSAFKDKYKVTIDSTETNGTLSLWYNCLGYETYDIRMSAELIDSRTGHQYVVLTDPVTIMSQTPAEAEWDFSVVHDVNIQYNPLVDRLKLYDWLIAKGKSVNKADYLDATAYDLNLPFIVTKGHTKYTPDSHITFELKDHSDDSVLNNASWVKEFDNTHIRIDQRKLPHKTLVVDVLMKVDGGVQSTEQLTFSRVMPHVQVLMCNNSNIDLYSTSRWERAVVMFDDYKVEYPEAYLAIKWDARSSLADQWTEQGYGELVDINQSALGVTVGGNDMLYLRAQCYIKRGVSPLSNTDVFKGADGTSVVASTVSATRNEIYIPLSITTSVTPSGQPLIQTDGYASGRRTEDNPLILTPSVQANSPEDDLTWVNGNCNALLTNIKWLANGKDISTLPAFADRYSISDDESSTNGTLSLWYNCTGYEMYDLQMSATLVDTRNRRKYIILSDPVTIMSQTPAEAEWDFSVVHDVNIQYNPLIDRLKLYDWLVSKGLVEDTPANEADYTDATAYKLHLPLLITHGHQKYTPTATDDSITFRLQDHNSGVYYTTDDTFFLTSVSNTAIDVDLRYMCDDNLVLDVQMYVDDALQSTEQLTFSRYYPHIEVITMNKSNVDLEASTRWDKALVAFDGKPVEHPEAYLYMAWEASPTGLDGSWKAQGEGENITINQDSLSLIDDLYVRIGYSAKSGLAPLTNANGSYITDATHNIIIAETLR